MLVKSWISILPWLLYGDEHPSGKWTRKPGEFIFRAGGSSAALPLEKIKF